MKRFCKQSGVDFHEMVLSGREGYRKNALKIALEYGRVIINKDNWPPADADQPASSFDKAAVCNSLELERVRYRSMVA